MKTSDDHLHLLLTGAIDAALRRVEPDRARRRAAHRRELAGVPEAIKTSSSPTSASIPAGRGSIAQKAAAALALQQKYAKITDQLTQQIRDAATKIAQQKQLKLVVTREGIGYGGVDITGDVEKSLNITEKATPTPGT